MHRAVLDRADLAEALGDDEVGREPPKRLRLDRDDRPPGGAQTPHLGVDGLARGRGVYGGDGHPRKPGDRRRIVALVGDPHEVLRSAQRGHDLGGGGQQSDDPHPSDR